MDTNLTYCICDSTYSAISYSPLVCILVTALTANGSLTVNGTNNTFYTKNFACSADSVSDYAAATCTCTLGSAHSVIP